MNISITNENNTADRDVRDLPVKPLIIPWKNKDVPHVTLEVNNHCNIDCHGCYKKKTGTSKSLELIKQEIDLAMTLRNLTSVSIMGGEPTLFEELPEVISYITGKGLLSMLLTNGTLLSPEKLMRYKEAGLGKVYLHIDSHQKERPDFHYPATESELNELRLKYVNMCKKAGIQIGMVVTLYKDILNDFNTILDFCYNTSNVTSVLCTDYNNIIDYNDDDELPNLTVNNGEVFDYMLNTYNAVPAYYLPSTDNLHSLRWLGYSSIVAKNQDGSVSTFYFHPEDKLPLYLIPRIAKTITGKYHFDNKVSEKEIYAFLKVYALLSFKKKTRKRVKEFLTVCKDAQEIKYFHFVFQQPPNEKEDGSFEQCNHCPDATIRNGKLVPICMVDKLEPYTTEI
ncbi:MAG: radical SAM protein [bacterium]|nr:radical SAM protein [bacterium]